MFRLFKITAFLEGISYLLLFANMLIVKPINMDLYKGIVFPLGMAHGALFVGYLLLAVSLREERQWKMKDFLIILVASVLPFGTFYVDKTYLKSSLS